MLPDAVLIVLDLETIWHARRFVTLRDVAGPATRPRRAAAKGFRACPRSSGIFLTNPADVLAWGAVNHSTQFSIASRRDLPNGSPTKIFTNAQRQRSQS